MTSPLGLIVRSLHLCGRLNIRLVLHKEEKLKIPIRNYILEPQMKNEK